MGQYKGIVEGEGTNHNPRYLFYSIYDFINTTDVIELSEKIKKQAIDELIIYLDSLSEKSVSRHSKTKTKKRNNM